MNAKAWDAQISDGQAHHSDFGEYAFIIFSERKRSYPLFVIVQQDDRKVF